MVAVGIYARLSKEAGKQVWLPFCLALGSPVNFFVGFCKASKEMGDSALSSLERFSRGEATTISLRKISHTEFLWGS